MALYKRGKVWWMSFTFGDRQVRESTGQTNRDSAEEVWARVKVNLISGTYLPEEHRPTEPGCPVFEVAVASYIEQRKGQGKRADSYGTLVGYKKNAGIWTGTFRGRRLDSITSEEIEVLLRTWQQERRWSNATRNNHLAQLAGLFSYAYARRWIQSHPTENGRVPELPVDNERNRWLRRHEVDEIKKHVPGWLRDIIEFAVITGFRLERICELRKADYEADEAGHAYVVIERDKNGERVHKMIEGGLRILVEKKVEAAQFPASHLFPGPGGASARTAIKRHLRTAVEKAGIKWGRAKDGVTFHTFRHTMASNALNAGIPVHLVQKLGNWKDPRMLGRYAHLADETLRDAESKITKLFAGRVSHRITGRQRGRKA